MKTNKELQIAATTIGLQFGTDGMAKFMKDNPGIKMPPMPMELAIDLTKAGVEFSVGEDDKHNP